MATQTIPRLELDPGDVFEALAGDTYVILAYTDGDWDGAEFVSSTPGVPFTLQIPSDIAVSDVTFSDCHAAGGEIDATDGGVDGGGNDNILFAVPGTSSSSSSRMWVGTAIAI